MKKCSRPLVAAMVHPMPSSFQRRGAIRDIISPHPSHSSQSDRSQIDEGMQSATGRRRPTPNVERPAALRMPRRVMICWWIHNLKTEAVDKSQDETHQKVERRLHCLLVLESRAPSSSELRSSSLAPDLGNAMDVTVSPEFGHR